MRYVFAMLFAIAGAAAAMVYLSQDVADRVVATYRFDNPDQVADLHMAIYMATNVLGLLAGWIVGWVLTWPFARRSAAK
ncbi:MAG: hypothetical protein ACRCS9_10065 [Hyphomicrobium sp.]